jgi:ATP-dependent DNA helicase RecG
MPAMITLDTLTHWLAAPAESEHLEFKEAKQQFDTTKLLRYCVALANEGGGHLILGVSDRPPRKVVGSQAFAAASDLNGMKARIVEKLRIRVDAVELALFIRQHRRIAASSRWCARKSKCSRSRPCAS